MPRTTAPTLSALLGAAAVAAAATLLPAASARARVGSL